MGKRGRPPHPDILTPREWEVLAFLRQRLTNEQIALRLDVTKRRAVTALFLLRRSLLVRG